MAIKILELHHQGVRVGGSQEEADRTMSFYKDVLGLGADPGRPNIPGIPGHWVDVGGRAQIHLMGVNGESRYAKGPGMDPSLPHVAFAVEDIVETRKELERMGTKHWVAEGIVGPQSQQIFMHDPSGNMIELHQAGTCRCQAITRVGP
jgi:catechol 2,3-dioxygenase-like lactoylglutathione lyase family enzyme